MAVTADRLSPLARRLIPSFADLLFAFLLVTQIQPSLFSDADTGWHLWAGFQALAHGPGPLRDTLTYSRAGAEWVSTQWLGEVALALAYRYAGYLGVAVLCAAVFASTFAWLYRIVWSRSRHVLLSLAVTLLAAGVTWTHFLARPLAFAYPLFLGVVVLARRKRIDGRSAAGIVLLVLLWSNVHPSAALAPCFLAILWLTRRNQRWLGLAAIGSAVALAATPAGPWWFSAFASAGPKLHLLHSLDEWKAPRFHEPRYWALLVMVVVAIAARGRAAMVRRRARANDGPRLASESDWAGAIEGSAWLGGSLLIARVAPFAALAWAPEMAIDLAGGTRARDATSSGFERIAAPFESVLRPAFWPVALTLLLGLAAPKLSPRFPETARGFPPHEFPVAALAAADRLELGSRVLTSYDWAGFVEWTSGGRRRVYVDSRGGFFSGDLLRDYLQMTHLAPGWRDALERAEPDWILLPSRMPLATAVASDPRWRVEYRDTLAVVVTRAPRP